MSFLTEAAARRVATLQVPRTLMTSAPRASFASGVTLQKSATESAKDTLKTVDRAVSDKLVDGINIGTTVANKVKEATDNVTTKSAAELRGEASGKASELAGKAQELGYEASGKTSEYAGKAKGTASEMAGKAEGTAEKYAGKAKGAAERAKRSL